MTAMKKFIHPSTLFRWMFSLYPPYFFTGIKLAFISRDFRELRVQMRLRWYNRNYVGTHFGGSLFAMTDPWYMLMLMQILGKDYIVWDRSGCIEFMKPGTGLVTCKFVVSDAMLADIKEKTANGEKYLPEFPVEVIDEKGDVVVTVKKGLYIRKKRA